MDGMQKAPSRIFREGADWFAINQIMRRAPMYLVL